MISPSAGRSDARSERPRNGSPNRSGAHGSMPAEFFTAMTSICRSPERMCDHRSGWPEVTRSAESRNQRAPGTRLGPYEITAQIGVGGMGEVYRARDTKLDRDVAIKVLPEAVAQNPERLARFDREARTLAALNHPNIAQIHGQKSGGN